MTSNQGTIIHAERFADDVKVRAILREWGYEENEILVLKEQRVTRKLDESDGRSGQLAGAPAA